jgi:hypothetical protein
MVKILGWNIIGNIKTYIRTRCFTAIGWRKGIGKIIIKTIMTLLQEAVL